jgi:hypothetical protein
MAIYEPKVNDVSLSPNPVNINKSFLISVSVSEVEVVMYTVSPIAGAVKSGQSVVLTTYKEVS